MCSFLPLREAEAGHFNHLFFTFSSQFQPLFLSRQKFVINTFLWIYSGQVSWLSEAKCAINWPYKQNAIVQHMKFSLLVSVASTVTLCQLEASRSKALATVIVPLFGSILKAFVVSLLLSMEYLEEKSQTHTFRRQGCFLGKQNIVIPQGD